MNSVSNYLQAGAGKANRELRQFSDGTFDRKVEGEVLYVSSRAEVEAGDLSRILDTFVLIPSEQLSGFVGKVHFAVDGYDDDPAELYEIPKVREFYAKVHRYWPVWLTLGSIDSDCLQSVVYSIAPNLTVTRDRAFDLHEVEISEKDLTEFFMASLVLAAFIHSRLGFTKAQGVEHLKRVADYLGVPETVAE